MDDTFAIVVTFNGAQWIGPCLASLMRSDYPASIIVVDNASTDGTLDIVKGFPGVQVVRSARNLGFAAANNIGVQLAMGRGADYVLLLNQDAQVKPETIGRLVEHAQRDNGYGVLSPLHLNGSETGLDLQFQHWLEKGAPAYFSDLSLGAVRPVYSIGFVNAAAWLISRACLEQVGGFDPLFHMYDEDADYCRRAAQHGFKLGVVSSAVAVHSRGVCTHMHAGGWRRRWWWLRLLSGRVSNRFILRVKDPARPFVHQCLIAGVDLVCEMLHGLALLDPRKCANVAWASLTIPFLLPRAWRHRKIGSVGALWAEPLRAEAVEARTLQPGEP